jgi:hypothetical protein
MPTTPPRNVVCNRHADCRWPPLIWNNRGQHLTPGHCFDAALMAARSCLAAMSHQYCRLLSSGWHQILLAKHLLQWGCNSITILKWKDTMARHQHTVNTTNVQQPLLHIYLTTFSIFRYVSKNKTGRQRPSLISMQPAIQFQQQVIIIYKAPRIIISAAITQNITQLHVVLLTIQNTFNTMT